MLNNIEVAEIPAFLSCVRVAPETGIEAIKKAWKHLHISMQFGVVQDYADSIGYDVNAFKSLNDDMNGYVYVSSVNDNCVDDTHKTRDEARKAAIKAFDDIVNRESRKVNHK